MRNCIIAAIWVSLFSTSITPQVTDLSIRHHYKQCDWEISFSSSLGLSSTTYENFPQYYNDSNGEIYSELSVSLGFFILEGLSVEPELDYQFFPNDAALSLLGSISYTFNVPPQKFYPYLTLGYGFSNYLVFGHEYSNESLFESLHAGLINLGAGLKIIQSNDFALKLEVNYKMISYKSDGTAIGIDDYSVKTSLIQLKFGTSFLL